MYCGPLDRMKLNRLSLPASLLAMTMHITVLIRVAGHPVLAVCVGVWWLGVSLGQPHRMEGCGLLCTWNLTGHSDRAQEVFASWELNFLFLVLVLVWSSEFLLIPDCTSLEGLLSQGCLHYPVSEFSTLVLLCRREKSSQ